MVGFFCMFNLTRIFYIVQWRTLVLSRVATNQTGKVSQSSHLCVRDINNKKLSKQDV